MELASYLSTYGPKPLTLACQHEGELLPAEEGTPATVTLLPLDSGKGRIAAARFSTAQDGNPEAQYEALLALLTDLAVSWTLPFPFSPQSALIVFREIGWLADAAWKALNAQADFTAASATP